MRATMLLIMTVILMSGCSTSSLMPYDDQFECRLSKKEKGMCGTMGQVHDEIIKEEGGE